jgi:hypothetical protein
MSRLGMRVWAICGAAGSDVMQLWSLGFFGCWEE